MQMKDLTGQKFGKLTVIRFDRKVYKVDSKGKSRNQNYWICKCDCGNQVSVSTQNLTSGDKKSCGCLKFEMGRKRAKKYLNDLTGNKFGKLTVIKLDNVQTKTYPSGNKRNLYYWKCKCACGNEVVVEGRKLKRGKINSCEDIKINNSKTYTQIGYEYAKQNLLKEGTRLNFLNNKTSSANTSGIRGVGFSKEKNKYKARIVVKGKEYHLGYFDTIGEAEKARENAEKQYFLPILEKYNYKNKEVEEEFE